MSPLELKPEYAPKTSIDHLGYLIEEAGEVLQAAGKSLRWGLDSWNPELKPSERESNEQWLRREMHDLARAIDLMTKFLDQQDVEE